MFWVSVGAFVGAVTILSVLTGISRSSSAYSVGTAVSICVILVSLPVSLFAYPILDSAQRFHSVSPTLLRGTFLADYNHQLESAYARLFGVRVEDLTGPSHVAGEQPGNSRVLLPDYICGACHRTIESRDEVFYMYACKRHIICRPCLEAYIASTRHKETLLRCLLCETSGPYLVPSSRL